MPTLREVSKSDDDVAIRFEQVDYTIDEGVDTVMLLVSVKGGNIPEIET